MPHASLATDEHFWTFAYGANIGKEKLQAAHIHPAATLPATLPRHQLVFSPALGDGPAEPAFADVRPVSSDGDPIAACCRGGRLPGAASPPPPPQMPPAARGPGLSPVEGVVHEVSASELAELDRTEAPLYHRRRLPVELHDGGPPKTLPAWVYVGEAYKRQLAAVGGRRRAAGGGEEAGAAAAADASHDGGAATRVQLAISPLRELPGAYHTSVVLNGRELVFDPSGISAAEGVTSHAPRDLQLVDAGTSALSEDQLKAALAKDFAPDSYDLIRRNCNTFTDAALMYLLHRHLEPKYRMLEAKAADLGPQAASKLLESAGFEYRPNPEQWEAGEATKPWEEVDITPSPRHAGNVVLWMASIAADRDRDS